VARHRWPTVHIIHGIKTSKTNNRLAMIKKNLLDVGFRTEEVIIHSYGYMPFILSPRLENKKIAEKIAEKIGDGDIIIAHSNGCAIAWEIAEMGAKIYGAVLINPALDADKVFPHQVKWVHVFYNRDDWVVGLAKYMPFHIWGDQGRIGPKFSDPRYSLTEIPDHKNELGVWEHSAVINEKDIWFPEISNLVREKVKILETPLPSVIKSPD